jgi:hypothetical protein
VNTGHEAEAEQVAKVRWNAEPAEHDYPAAASYLSLLAAPALIAAVVADLKAAPTAHFKAKDILRAAGLALLPASDPHVSADLKTIRNRRPLSPVLLVQGDLFGGIPLQIADGYHRVCATYLVNEATDIPCRLATHRVPPRA